MVATPEQWLTNREHLYYVSCSTSHLHRLLPKFTQCAARVISLEPRHKRRARTSGMCGRHRHDPAHRPCRVFTREGTQRCRKFTGLRHVPLAVSLLNFTRVCGKAARAGLMRTYRLDSVSGSDRVECDLVHIQIEFFLRRTRLVILRQRFGRMGQANIGGAVGHQATCPRLN